MGGQMCLYLTCYVSTPESTLLHSFSVKRLKKSSSVSFSAIASMLLVTEYLVHCCTLSLWYLGAETDDQHRNPNMNDKDHLVGQLTTEYLTVSVLVFGIVTQWTQFEAVQPFQIYAETWTGTRLWCKEWRYVLSLQIWKHSNNEREKVKAVCI